MILAFSRCELRCQSARAAYSCASGELRRTRPIRGAMPLEAAMSPCVVALLAARQSSAFAACVCAGLLGLVSHVMRGEMHPAFAIATWLAGESKAMAETVVITRTAESVSSV